MTVDERIAQIRMLFASDDRPRALGELARSCRESSDRALYLKEMDRQCPFILSFRDRLARLSDRSAAGD